LLTLAALFLAPLFTVACMAQSETAKGNLTNPFYIQQRAGDQHIELDNDWELSYRDSAISSPADLHGESKWVKAQVPGSVEVSLFRAGELPSPYVGMNAKKYDWVLGKIWYYRKSFATPAAAKGDYVFLCFDGVDYYARIWLNGHELGRHEGMHGGPMLEVSSLLKSDGRNELVVEVRAPNYGMADKFASFGYEMSPKAPADKVVVPWGLNGGLGLITGGDLPQKLKPLPGREVSDEDYFPMGIWRPVRLEIAPRTHLERPFLATLEANRAQAKLLLDVEVQVGTTGFDANLNQEFGSFRDASTSKLAAAQPELQFQLLDKVTGRAVFTKNFALKIYEGRNWVHQEIEVPSPKLWWPNGLGDPYLYRVKLSLVQQKEAADTMEFDFGIRTLRRIPSAGPKTQDRWANWQFVVNDRKFLVKGMDWWTNDILLDLPRDRYEWALKSAQAAGIQLLRTWGSGIVETNDFYELCDRLGILVWQDFPIGNQETASWPQDIWQEQVMQNVFRIRNHSSLALYSGGNEFDPYTPGNVATQAIMQRSFEDFDGTRPFVRTTPDKGDIHTYPNIDPTWFRHMYPMVPYISEFGPHSVPEARAIREFVDAKELEAPLRNLESQEFMDSHPEFVYHDMEYGSDRTVLLMARASQVDDMKAPSLEEYSVAGQVATGEFIQIVSDFVQSNYPVSTGLSPWVYNTPWPLSTFCMFVDYDGQPVASYYFLKRTYEPVHVIANLPELIWGKGEKVPLSLSVMNSRGESVKDAIASVQVLDTSFHSLLRLEKKMDVKAGLSVSAADMGSFTIPASLEGHFFLVVAELKGSDGALISRSVYWPRCLKEMSDDAYREKYRASPQPSLTFENGPWLRKEVQAKATKLELTVTSTRMEGENRSVIEARVRNAGSEPAFYTEVNIDGTKRTFYATDNGFWLAPNEERLLKIHVWWRDPATRPQAVLTLGAWNATTVQGALGNTK
jgi:beta-mannosidase